MYLTAQEYADLTGRPQNEATEAAINLASRLLDSRIGYYPFAEDYKLDLDLLTTRQVDIVKLWVAQMIANNFDNDGSVEQLEDSVSLGRFSVDRGNSRVSGNLIPSSMQYTDELLIDSGLIRRLVDKRNECKYL